MPLADSGRSVPNLPTLFFASTSSHPNSPSLCCKVPGGAPGKKSKDARSYVKIVAESDHCYFVSKNRNNTKGRLSCSTTPRSASTWPTRKANRAYPFRAGDYAIRIDDIVEVITGDDVGKRGKSAREPREQQGDRPGREPGLSPPGEPNNPQGGRLSKEMPLAASNVQLIDPATNADLASLATTRTVPRFLVARRPAASSEC